MPKIVITEIDNTSPGVITDSTDVVYIPGFVNVDKTKNPNLYETDELGNITDEYIGLEVNKPTLFTSVSQFESLCGYQPAYFSDAQLYSSLSGITADGSLTGFSNDAVPYTDIMFKAGVADPSYIMAKELIASGLPVLYQRINQSQYSTEYKGIDAGAESNPQPADWEQHWNENYQIQQTAYVQVDTATAPLMFTKQNGNQFDNTKQYYVRTTYIDDTSNVLTVAFVPIDMTSYEQSIKTTRVIENGEPVEILSQEGLVVDVNTGEKVPGYYTYDNEDGDSTTHYFTKTLVTFTNTVTPTWETGKYYKPVTELLTIEPGDWTTANYKYYELKDNQLVALDTSSLDFVEDTYYQITDGTEVIESETAPQDYVAGSSSYYTRESGPGTGYTYTQVTITNEYNPTFSTETYLREKAVDEGEPQEYEVLTTQPEDWGTANTFYTLGTEVLPQSTQIPETFTFNNQKYSTGVAGVTINRDTNGYIIPYSWIVGFKQGVMQFEDYVDIQPEAGQEVPTWDPNKTYRSLSDGINIQTMYDALSTVYAINDYGLMDKGNYSIKYLTSGGYPTYEYNDNALVTMMMNLAEKRGDCVAFIDHTNNSYREQNIDLPGSLYNKVKKDLTFQTGGEFATMFTPWCNYNRITIDTDNLMRQIDEYNSSVDMPGSYAFFLGLADSITVNPNWLAIAGVARGLVQNLSASGVITNIPNGTADAMEPRDGIAINPITNIRPYGYTIWGNRTLKNNATQGNLTATSFLNIRNLVSDIKKEIYRTARKLTFEQNSDVLWVNFKAELTPLLDRMLHGYGISNYKLQIDTDSPHYGERATLCVKVIISPVESVEDFYVSVVMVDNNSTEFTEG